MDMWLEYNDFMLLKEGTGYVGRFMGKRMWERLKYNEYGNLNLQTDEDTLSSVLNYFNNQTENIEDINYRISDKSLKISLKSPINHMNFMVEDLLTKYLQPIAIITRAGMKSKIISMCSFFVNTI